MSRGNTLKIGIMGGAFDPIHYGHLMIAENAREQFDLNQVLFIPTGQSTLEKLKNRYTSAELFFILGADSLFDFERWKEPEEILKNCSILAAYRKHKHQEKFFQKIDELNQKYPGKFFPLDTPNLEVSSQDIRRRLQYGRTIRYLVPKEVEEYIRIYHLYETHPK